jgi:hypothetical protein
MASVIRFGTIELPKSAVSITSFRTIEQNYTDGHLEPQYSVISKNRNLFANTTTAVDYQYYVYDMGNADSRSCDYLAVIRADKIQRDRDKNLDIELYTDADGLGSFTLRHTINYTYTNQRLSPRDQDYIEEFTSFSTTHRYWAVRAETDSGATVETWQFTGFFFGTLFDIGSDPEDFTAKRNLKSSVLTAENGTTHTHAPIYQPIEFTISWLGITDAKVLALKNLIDDANRHGIILYTTNTDLTDGYSMCHCDSMEVESSRIWTDYNSVTVKLKEVL